MPSPGLVRSIRPSSGPGIRDDGGVLPGYAVPVFYDSLIAKLIAWAGTRSEAIGRIARALEEYELLGIRTTIPFFLWLMREPDFLAGRLDTTWLDRLLASRQGVSFSAFSDAEEQALTIAAALDAMFHAGGAFAANARQAGGGAWKVAARQEALRA